LKGAQPGDVLILVGDSKGHMGASAYARTILGLDGAAAGSAPPVDLAIEKRTAEFIRELVRDGLVNAVHDVSEGGVACATAEIGLSSGHGVVLTGDWTHAELVGEDQARYLLA